MLANFLIGLREGLEAALIVAILVTYLVRMDERRHLVRIWQGVGAAVALSLAVGGALQFVSEELGEEAEEVFAGITSLAAVVLVTWMIMWMAVRARNLRAELHGRVDRALADNPTTLALVAFVAVLREGLETALFLYAGIKAAGDGVGPVTGAVLGLATAVALGVALYRGMVRLDLGKVFTWSAYALIVVAAGILRYGVHEFQEVGLLPETGDPVYDVSNIVVSGGWLETLLKGTVNFSTHPTPLEVVVWAGYIVIATAVYRSRARAAVNA